MDGWAEGAATAVALVFLLLLGVYILGVVVLRILLGLFLRNITGRKLDAIAVSIPTLLVGGWLLISDGLENIYALGFLLLLAAGLFLLLQLWHFLRKKIGLLALLFLTLAALVVISVMIFANW